MKRRTTDQARRHIRVVLFIASAMLILASCGDDDGATETPEEESTSDDAATDSDEAVEDTPERLFVAYEDGFCANSFRVHARADLELEISRHPEITEFVYSCAEGDLTKYISDIESLVTQEADIILTLPDWGVSTVPALRDATEAGVLVVGNILPAGGESGVDYAAEVFDDLGQNADLWVDYFAEKLPDGGLIVGIGGTAGNVYDPLMQDLMQEGFAERAPNIEFAEVAPGDYDPTVSLQAMTALLAKYDEIDGVWSLLADPIPSYWDAFESAGRPLPVTISFDQNQLIGDFLSRKPDNPDLELGFVTSRTWITAETLKVALDIYNGNTVDPERLSIQNVMIDCSIECEALYQPDMPGAYIPSSKVPTETLRELLQ